MRVRRSAAHEAAVLSSIAMTSKAYWAYSSAQLADWRESLTITPNLISTSPTFVAEVDGQIVGFFVLLPATPDWVLDHLWVIPSSMRMGVGRALLKQAVNVASAGGAQAIVIDSDPGAEIFYLACGAVRVGTVAAPIEGAADRVRPQLLIRIASPNMNPGNATTAPSAI